VNNSKLNINSATYKKEKLEKFETELNYIENGEKIYFGKTVVFQDVDKYRERDIKKFRDMEVGMIPPKLAQIMINISEAKFGIYDPFVGLGTIPIEAINSGYKNIFGSDISTELTLKTKKNLRSFFDKKIDNLNTLIFQMDACNIDSKLPKDAYDQILKSSIVTEGLLGEVMTKGNITIEKIEKQRYILKNLYEKFFTGLKKIGFKGNIVISFPFWDLNGKYLYLKEIYEIFRILEIKIQKLLPDGIEFKETKEGSLLYKRDDQQVGREIFKLKF
ncbi:hypothetical protein KAZ01_03075, partial [Candidatus Gracilibacteria bacterium]|nr:hypothetical protein [Candidatus Gracilibacteria bacterium]